MLQDLMDLNRGSPNRSPNASPLTSPKHRSSLGTPRVATQLNWFRGNSISQNLNGSVSVQKLHKVWLLPYTDPLPYMSIIFTDTNVIMVV